MNNHFIRTTMDSVRVKSPLVHNITNYVTAGDCANILLAGHASPIMADDIHEVVEITSLCNALVLNIGTLNERTVASMKAAGKRANALGNPIVLDPVGAGASIFRTETAKSLVKELNITVIRGNISEIKALYENTFTTVGVDANEMDAVNEDNLIECVNYAKKLAESFNTIIAITGAIDIVASENNAYVIRNGHAQMRNITGTGCMLTSLIGAYVASNQSQPLNAVAAAVALMGVSGEMAFAACAEEKLGTNSMKARLIDFVSTLTPEEVINRYKGECL